MATEDDERTFSIGRVFSRAFGVMGRNPLVTFGTALLLSAVPYALITYGFAQLNIDLRDRNTLMGFVGSVIILSAIGMVLRALVQGCLVRATIADGEGRTASFAECFGVAAARALPLIGVSILFILGLIVGMVLLIVPGIMFAVACAVVVPVVVEEPVGVIEAFGRASVLTRGARWKIFGLALVVLILIWLFEAVVGVAQITLFQPGTNPFGLALILFNGLGGTLITAFSSTMQTGLYVELRNWKDGPQNAQLTDIFA